MKNKYSAILIFFSLLCFTTCKKDIEPPIVINITTVDASQVTAISVISGGTIKYYNSEYPITARGVCWSTTQNPTITNAHTSDSSGSGDYISEIIGLTPNVKYYVRAYATNSQGTYYGAQKSFTTLSGIPTLTTTAISNITATTAISGGNITNDNGLTVIARGVCWSTTQNPTLTNAHASDSSGFGDFISEITGLTPNVKYYVRSYATNEKGTYYGEQKSFTTLSGVPTITTAAVTSITLTTAISGGDITNDNGLTVTARGVCWSTTQNPTLADAHTIDGSGTGSFTSNLTGLTIGITYYVRAYVTNSQDTYYGEQKNFITLSGVPTLTTTEASNITTTTATSGGNITNDNGLTVTARGVCWSTTQNPTVADAHTTDGSGTGSFTSNMTGLSSNTTYYVRAYAINSQGFYYGTQKSFTTLSGIPTITTSAVSNITATTATSGGNITNNNGLTVTVRGVCWSTTQNPTIADAHSTDGSGTGSFTSNMTDLSPNTTYNVRAYATNSQGTYYGEQKSFTTLSGITTLTTAAVTNITLTTATSGGNITNDNGLTVIARGVCWSTTQNPTIADAHTTDGSGTGSFTSNMTGLIPNTTYNVRAYATNSQGTYYGEPKSITTLSGVPTITTTAASNITATTATSGGNITYDNGLTVTACGVCWSITQNPTVADAHTTDGSGTGSFTSNMTGLIPNTTYNVRAYATNSQGTYYGEPKSITTLSGVPTITTTAASNITATTATSGGNITNDNGLTVTARGVCWSITQNPTIADAHTTDGSGTGSFTSNMTGLSPNTTYNVRAYATNSQGTYYGEQKNFTTLSGIPTLTTSTASNITATTATSGCNITNDNGLTVTACGVCWSITQNPTVADAHSTDGIGTGSFTSNMTGLIPNTTYNVRAYATNSQGTYYGEQKSFTTLSGIPTLTTSTASNITATTATSGCNITNDNGLTVTACGVCWSITQNPTVADAHTTDGSGTGSFTSNMTGLIPNTIYNVRAYATNSQGTYYGEQKSFTTLSGIATLTTAAVTNITLTTATSGGNITNDNGLTVIARGVCWSITQNPTIIDSHTTNGSGTGNFTSNMTDLSPNTIYNVRAYATNSQGTYYGEQKSFTTLSGIATLTTAGVNNISAITATSGGNITNDNGLTVTARGVCWSITQNPTIIDSHTTNGSGTGSFTSNLTDLSPNSTYYVRAYATNSHGTYYGEQKNFTTLSGIATLTTSGVSNITAITATSGGNITNANGLTVTTRGVCWSTTQNPTITDNHTTDGSGIGSFTSNLTSLSPNTAYYVRSYATNSQGTYYGEQKNITTLSGVPTLATTAVSNITLTIATCGGDIINDNGLTVTARGVCWSTTQNPTITNSYTTDGSGTGSFISYITGLSLNTTYYVRAYATNSQGTYYGEQTSFATLSGIPTLTTAVVSDITAITATCGGNITNANGLTVTARGVCWSITQNPTVTDSHTYDGNGIGSFTSNITGLSPFTSYFVRAYATNSHGTYYGEQIILTTLDGIPLLTTSAVSSINWTTATCGGSISSDGGLAVTARGVCWSTAQNPTVADAQTTDGSGTGSFTSNLIGLSPDTTYYVRAYATNSQGTYYGEQMTFTTLDEYRTFIVNGISFKMISVGGGTFSMGGTSGNSDEQPVHSVTLSDYYMGETEVTQQLWGAVMGSNPSIFTGDVQRPVEFVSWYDCQSFISALNQLTGEQFGLPTEAQWEFAARGGNLSNGYTYSGSNTLDNVAWHNSISNQTTHPVKTKAANELGIYDMSGNVWEWCSDWMGYYGSVSQTNPTGPSSGSYRVLRGGGWGNSAGNCRVSNRDNCAPDRRYNDYGFRVVLLP